MAADVCKCLNLANPSKAMYRLDPADRSTITLTGGKGMRGNPNVNAVTEADSGKVRGTWIVFMPEAIEIPAPPYEGPLPF